MKLFHLRFDKILDVLARAAKNKQKTEEPTAAKTSGEITKSAMLVIQKRQIGIVGKTRKKKKVK